MFDVCGVHRHGHDIADSVPRIGRGLEPRDRAGFVEQIDGAVGQPVVAEMTRRELRGGLERGVRVGDAVMALVPGTQAGKNPYGFLD